MDESRFDVVTRIFASSSSRRLAIGGWLTGLLALLSGAREEGTALARRRRRKREKRRDRDRCPKSRRCGGDCCKRSMECCDGKCRDNCGPGRKRDKRTCTCVPCTIVGDGSVIPTCTTDGECCSDHCGFDEVGLAGTCRSRVCQKLGERCSSTTDCCDGACFGNEQVRRCICPRGFTKCGGKCRELCPTGFIRDRKSCRCRCRKLGETCPADLLGGIDSACCSEQCGCGKLLAECTCRRSDCRAEDEPCDTTDDCCEGTCEGVGVLKTCRTST